MNVYVGVFSSVNWNQSNPVLTTSGAVFSVYSLPTTAAPKA